MQVVQTICRHLKTYFLIYAGLLIYLLFYISVAWTGWFDIFFSGAALHAGAKGIDFYQIPRGAWSFWHGGSLAGDVLSAGSPYTSQYFANGNVYHPFFSLLFGSFLTLFDPARAPYVWLWTKLLLSLLVISCFFWNFRTSKYINFAVFILFANFSIYLELAAWQFQFMLNMFLLLFLISLVKKRSAYWSGVLYWLGMLVKPVGLLFAPVLLFKRRWEIVLFGISLFILSTAVFVPHGADTYYIDNLKSTLTTSGSIGPNQIITLSALLHFTTHWPDFVYQAIQNGLLLVVVFLSALRRIPITKASFLYVVYYLCFYQGVYEYQWSTLAYVLAACVVTCPEFRTKPAIFCILLTCLPDCFVLLNLLHIDVKNLGYLGLIPGVTAWKWMVVSKLLPLALLLATVLSPDIKPIFIQVKAFWHALRQVNDRLGVFGTEPEDEAASETVQEATPALESAV